MLTALIWSFWGSFIRWKEVELKRQELFQYYMKKNRIKICSGPVWVCPMRLGLFSLRFWFKADTIPKSGANRSHVSALEERAGLSCSGLCNTQPSCEFSLLSLMRGRVHCQPARLPALINLISLQGRTPRLTSGLHAPTPPQFSLTATEPKHSAAQEAGSDQSVTRRVAGLPVNQTSWAWIKGPVCEIS